MQQIDKQYADLETKLNVVGNRAAFVPWETCKLTQI